MNIYALSYKDFLLEYIADKLIEDINPGLNVNNRDNNGGNGGRGSIDNGLNKDFSKYAVVFPGKTAGIIFKIYSCK
jgi:hypothetical protein